MTTKSETETAPTPGATTADLREQARVVKDDLREFGRTAKEIAQEKMSDVTQKAGEYTSEYYEKGKKKAVELEDRVEGYIRQKPLQSVLIAAGAGFVLGFLLTRR